MTTIPEDILNTINTCRLFIFDLDGTLYDQPGLRRKLSVDLTLKLFLFKIRPLDLKIITTFREERELHKGYSSTDLNEEQYRWCSERLNIHVSRVKQTIEKCMYMNPLRFILGVKYKGISEFFNTLRKKGKIIAIFSDFPVKEKMNLLQLKADSYFCSTDPAIGQMKPSAKALQFICGQMNCSIDEAILIGDRDDTDGESARQAGMKYLIIDKSEAKKGNYYKNLSHIMNKS
jgi:FMN phosphatase YigB (HAD superfamily)